MKTWKRMLGIGLALAMTFALMVGMSACSGNNTEPSTDPTASTPAGDPAPAGTGSYAFEGDYISTASDVRFHFVLVFAEDGSLSMTPGTKFYDVDDYDESASGPWIIESDSTLKFTIKSIDGTFNNDYEVPLMNGGYSFEMKLHLSGFVRPVTMTCVTEGYVPAESAGDPAPEATPDAAEPEETDGETSYPANTMVLEFTPDTSEQLKTTFFCESSVWGTALGATGAYEPTDSTDELFAWSNDGSYVLSFKADGTYEYQFEKVGIVENGTWTFEGWTLTATTANGNTYTAEIMK